MGLSCTWRTGSVRSILKRSAGGGNWETLSRYLLQSGWVV